MTNPALVVLAAGRGRRYEGLKQLDAIGPGSETLLEYSVYDAMRAGFAKVIFVIRREIEEDFRKRMGRKLEERIDVGYVYQEPHELPGGFQPPPGRTKPWGTGHALLSSGKVIDGPFAVINADDYYGAGSFALIADFLRRSPDPSLPVEGAMVAYPLRNTLSECGAVSRGICGRDKEGLLRDVTEFTKIESREGRIVSTDGAGSVHDFRGDEIVSMNLWGLPPSMFALLEVLFIRFLERHGLEGEAEFFLSGALNDLIASGQVRIRVLPTREEWFGVTFRGDVPRAAAQIRARIARGEYPERLWDRHP